MCEELNYYVVKIYDEVQLGYRSPTYRIPIQHKCKEESANEIAAKLLNDIFKPVSPTFNFEVIEVYESEYEMYFKLSQLREVLYYLPKLDYSDEGRKPMLEDRLVQECKHIMLQLELDWETDTVLNANTYFD